MIIIPPAAQDLGMVVMFSSTDEMFNFLFEVRRTGNPIPYDAVVALRALVGDKKVEQVLHATLAYRSGQNIMPMRQRIPTPAYEWAYQAP